MVGLPIGTCGAVAQSHSGPVIVILHQYALHGQGKTIHSSGQLELYRNIVDDRSPKVGGKQCIRTIDGYCFPIDIINGLPYTPMRPFTDEEYNTLPHVLWTSELDWDPTTLDTIVSDKPDWYNILDDLEQQKYHSPFDEFGNYCKREPLDAPIETHYSEVVDLHAEDKYTREDLYDFMYDRSLYESDSDSDIGEDDVVKSRVHISVH